MNPMSQVVIAISRPSAEYMMSEKKVVIVRVSAIFVVFLRCFMMSSAASFFVIVVSLFIGIPPCFVVLGVLGG